MLDADVLMLHHLPTNDEKYDVTERLLKLLKNKLKGVTIYGLLDLAATISEKVGERAAREVYASYLKSSEHVVLFPEYAGSWEEHIDDVIPFICRGLNYRDALIALTLDSHPDVEAYVTWRTRRFLEKVRFKVITPDEALRLLT